MQRYLQLVLSVFFVHRAGLSRASVECVDSDATNCPLWAKKGECDGNPTFMFKTCPLSCNVCHFSTEDEINQGIKDALMSRKINMGKEQDIQTEAQDNWNKAAEQYLKTVVHVGAKYREVKDKCQNYDERCTQFASQNACTTHKDYMMRMCPLVCQICNLLIFEERCPYDGNRTHDVFKPGDLNNMFERIAAHDGATVHSRDPWVITVDDFLTDQEADRIVELGKELGFKRSVTNAKKEGETFSQNSVGQSRTSSNTWCTNQCYEDPMVKKVMARVGALTGVPESYTDYLQLLHYDVGQYYKTHHDLIDYQIHREEGPRILTLFFYLNDVEEGGGTNFEQLDITVTPKKGRMLIWPSVISEEPMTKEPRTDHQALGVIRGEKYGANAWLYLRDYKNVIRKGCVN